MSLLHNRQWMMIVAKATVCVISFASGLIAAESNAATEPNAASEQQAAEFAAAPVSVRVVQPGFELTEFAVAPTVVTPTGIAVDATGNVFVLESNTHFPPADYSRGKFDRLLLFRDHNADGHADETAEIATGLTHAMSVAVQPNGDVYVATRRELRLYRDADRNGSYEISRTLLTLQTEGNYPHNGLAGIAFISDSSSVEGAYAAAVAAFPLQRAAFNEADVAAAMDASSWLYIGCGENLGADYSLVGSDGSIYRGGGEGGNMFRCRLDGSKLEHVATGFWNPHAACVLRGELFTVDNDPDSRPPCRLIHVVDGGDYGYRFRNGRKGLHPFTAWNGELPGTLPMLAGTGEAPSGMVPVLALTDRINAAGPSSTPGSTEPNAAPNNASPGLLVTSWGDHRIDYFPMSRSGASFESNLRPIVVGDQNFRPVGLAVHPNGSRAYFTDWVLQDYNLHQQGRVWCLKGNFGSPQLLAAPAASRAAIVASAIATEQSPGGLLTLAAEKLKHIRKTAGVNLPENSAAAPATAHTVSETSDASQSPDALHLLELAARFSSQPTAGQATGTSAADNAQELATVAGLFESGDPFVQLVAMRYAASRFSGEAIQNSFQKDTDARRRVFWLLSARRQNAKSSGLLQVALSDADPAVRRTAVQWAAEDRPTGVTEQEVSSTLKRGPVTAELFRSVTVGLQQMRGTPPADAESQLTGSPDWLWSVLQSADSPDSVRVLALRLMPAADTRLTTNWLATESRSANSERAAEAVIKLSAQSTPTSFMELTKIAADTSTTTVVRSLAVDALAAANTAESRDAALLILFAELESPDDFRSITAARALRGPVSADAAVAADVLAKIRGTAARANRSAETRAELLAQADLLEQNRSSSSSPPSDAAPNSGDSSSERHAALRAALLGSNASKSDETRLADVELGRRLFFHSAAAGCNRCHRIEGRGGNIGPDLSVVGAARNREQLLTAILEPSREIAPQYASWVVETTAGLRHVGMIVFENEGKTTLGDADGKLIELRTADIADRVSSSESVMPRGLETKLTRRELDALLTYLESLK